jgi:hypothetical protein
MPPQRLPLPLGKQSDKARSPFESIERLLNAYLHEAPTGKEPTPIYGTPGCRRWMSGLDGPIRGGIEMAGTPYVVAGAKLYSLAADGTPTDLGTIPGDDLVDVAGDGVNVVVVTDGKIYVWNGTTVGQVTDPDAPDASSVCYIDGFFVFGERDTEQWFISALRDPTSYDALDFASAEWKPDKLVRPFKHRDTLYLAGVTTLEAQQNTGAADFPFQAYQDLKVDVGLRGRDAITSTNDTVFWLAHDLTIRRLDGLSANVISTPAIGRIIAGWSDPGQTVASSHVWDHHLFVVFRNPEGCIVFDQSTQRWHERASYGSDTFRGRHYLEAYGLQLFGSAAEGILYALGTPEEPLYDEDGAVLPFEIVTPYAYAQNRRLTVNEAELVCETGVGTATLDPAVTCERSKDGATWSAPKIRHLGKQGQRGRRVLFGMQGQGRAMAFRYRISDPIKRAVLGAYVEVDVEAA